MRTLAKRLSFAALIVLIVAVYSLNAAKPVLVAPNNKAECVTQSVKMIWSKTPYAIHYTVEIAYDADFNNIIITSNNVTDTSYIANLNYDKTYFWRISANFVSYPSETSDVRYFSTKSRPPSLSLPLNNEKCIFGNTNFSWEVGADSFDIEIASDENFQTMLVTSSGLHTNTFTHLINIFGKTYWWRVRAYWGDCVTDFSEARSFHTPQLDPQLIYPENNVKGIPTFSDGMPFHTKFAWLDGKMTNNYRLQISNLQNFTNLIIDTVFASNAVYNLTYPESRYVEVFNIPLNYNTNYYWRVLTIDNGCEGKWSPYHAFKTPYPVVAGVSPANADECNSIIERFVWNQYNSASAYHIQIYKDAAMTDTVLNKSNIKDTSLVQNLNNSLTKFYWRVRAEDNTNIGLWSPLKYFTTTQRSPMPKSPITGATGLEAIFNLTWEDVDTSDVYDLQISTDPNFQSLITDVDGHNRPEFMVTLPLYNTLYYWKVRAKHNQCYSAWSQTFTFKTTLQIPVLTSPLDGAELLSLTPLMEWKAVKDAKTYTHQIAKDLLFQEELQETPYLNLTNARIDGYNYEEYTTYYWRVKALNNEGESQWSAPFKFTTGTIFPPIPTHLSPKDESIMQPTAVKLEWVKNPKVDSVEVQLFASYDLSKPAIFKATTDTLSVNVDGLKNFVIYYWRLRGKNIMGTSAWSPLWEFRTIDSALTLTPKCVYPKDKSENIKLPVPVSWQDLPRCNNYHLQLSKEDTFTNPIVDEDINNDEKYIYNLEYLTKYYWRVKAKNEAGWGDYSAVYSFTTCPDPAGVDEKAGDFSSSLFPNPVKGKAILSFKTDKMENITIRIEAINGKDMDKFNYFMSAGEHKIEINTENYPKGSYMYIIRSGNKSQTGKFVVIE